MVWYRGNSVWTNNNNYRSLKRLFYLQQVNAMYLHGLARLPHICLCFVCWEACPGSHMMCVRVNWLINFYVYDDGAASKLQSVCFFTCSRPLLSWMPLFHRHDSINFVLIAYIVAITTVPYCLPPVLPQWFLAWTLSMYLTVYLLLPRHHMCFPRAADPTLPTLLPFMPHCCWFLLDSYQASVKWVCPHSVSFTRTGQLSSVTTSDVHWKSLSAALSPTCANLSCIHL